MLPPPSADTLQGTVISRVSNAKAAALHREEPESAPPRMPRQPFSRVSSAVAGPSKLERTTSFAAPSTAQPIFSGKCFYALGAARCDELKKPLVSNGARWLDQADDLLSADFILVRLAESATHWQSVTSLALRAIMRTECWVEKCLYDERICDPDEHASFGPLKVTCPVPGAQELKVCWSGLGQAEVFWIKRMIKAIGEWNWSMHKWIKETDGSNRCGCRRRVHETVQLAALRRPGWNEKRPRAETRRAHCTDAVAF